MSERHPVSIVDLRRLRLGSRQVDPGDLLVIAAVIISRTAGQLVLDVS